ncbi:MAG TPA: endonuclease/exonuclease/phosphatase family protein [Candidatus Wallbacteria bacterium]|nr:endonuclease/exonuclease/phosphatase family protein [Candidatus Wallbacteria bacterium]
MKFSRMFLISAVFLALFFTALFITSGASFAQDGTAIKVISYNIACGQGSENNSAKYVGTKFLDEVVKVLKNEKADLIGMQEVDDNRFTTRFVKEDKYIADRLGMFYFWHEASTVGPFGQLNKHGNAVLSEHKMLKKEFVKYKAHGKSSDGGAATETRGVSCALLDIKGTKINFLSTHLGFPEYARVAQAKELVEYIKKLKDPVILVGDFNTKYSDKSESYRIINAALDNAYEKAKVKGALNTAHGMTPSKACIDFVFITPGFFSVEKVEAGGNEYNTASDHRPVKAILKFNKGVAAKAAAIETNAENEERKESVVKDAGTAETGSGGKSILDIQKNLFKGK